MKTSNIKLNIIYIYIFAVLEIFLNLTNVYKAETLKEVNKNNGFKSTHLWDLAHIGKTKTIPRELDTIKTIQGDLYLFSNYFQKFLASNFKKNKNFVDIKSNIQYEEKDKFIAEGNVTINFANGNLKTDKLIYEKNRREITLLGNVIYSRGNQYFEASKVFYEISKDNGYIENIYGVIDLKNFNNDIGLAIKNNRNYSKEIIDLKSSSSSSFGFVNEFNSGQSLNITDLNFDVPEINKWRFKSKKIFIKPNILESEEIFFTNDAYNKPQLLVESYSFKVENNNGKLKFISKNTWLNLDNKFKTPLGRKTFFDGEGGPLTRWGIGYDKEEKDGLFITRVFNNRKIFGDFNLKITPYFLIQRLIKGETKAFKGLDNSIFGNNISQDNSFGDIFGLNTNINGNINDWNLNLETTNNSLDLDKLSESSRVKLNIKKSIELDNLGKKSKIGFESSDINLKSNSFLDLYFATSFREKISKGFSGEEEIYFGNSLSVINRQFKTIKGNKVNYSFMYNFGYFNAKSKDKEELSDSLRNSFVADFSTENNLWKKKELTKSINQNYKYSPEVINQGLLWRSSFKTGLFLYENHNTQKAISLSTGPLLTVGSFTNDFFDFTKLGATASYIFKEGESIFAFDDINDSARIKFDLEQQLYGPLVFNLSSYLNLDSNHEEYGEFSESKFGLDIKRRAYKIGLFYKPDGKSLGIMFDIFSFNYSGFGNNF